MQLLGVCFLAEEWDIPFEQISDLEWLGSGAQGAVFKGKLRNQCVAVKKVRDVKETEIKHLRKLNHQNIIQFKLVFVIHFHSFMHDELIIIKLFNVFTEEYALKLQSIVL